MDSSNRKEIVGTVSFEEIHDTKISQELFMLTYGSLVSHLLKKYDGNFEVRSSFFDRHSDDRYIIHDFIAHHPCGDCKNLKEQLGSSIESAFVFYLNTVVKTFDWSADNHRFHIRFDQLSLMRTMGTTMSIGGVLHWKFIAGMLKGALENLKYRTEIDIVHDESSSSSSDSIDFIVQLFDE
ncbi:hypothetical protein ACOME3_004056 [Neoechinorhynchus agilis]